MAQNTLLVFTSDNGPEVHAYERIRAFHHYSMGELRGVKRDTWEGGHRVPFLARWPGQIPAGTVSRQMICLVDIFSTLCSLTGASPARGAGEDSLDVSAALRNPVRLKTLRSSLVYHGSSGWFALHCGDWVLIDGHTGQDNPTYNSEPEWFRKERHAQAPDDTGELFNLHDDPQETTNLYKARPDIVAQLKQELEAIKARRSGAAAN
jgi:arylsulfatase A-like enzyme